MKDEAKQQVIDVVMMVWKNAPPITNARQIIGMTYDAVLAALPTTAKLTDDEIESACPWLPETGHNQYRVGWYDGVSWASAEINKRRAIASELKPAPAPVAVAGLTDEEWCAIEPCVRDERHHEHVRIVIDQQLAKRRTIAIPEPDARVAIVNAWMHRINAPITELLAALDGKEAGRE